MATESRKITCAEHGEARATFVCKHLMHATKVEWISSSPTPEDPWPDAWCADCNKAFEVEGRWTDAAMALVSDDIRAICHTCYERARARCLQKYIPETDMQ
ncbi:MAG: hypothetical protein U0136_21935 [Bdellovibrionota bacterium]